MNLAAVKNPLKSAMTARSRVSASSNITHTAYLIIIAIKKYNRSEYNVCPALFQLILPARYLNESARRQRQSN